MQYHLHLQVLIHLAAFAPQVAASNTTQKDAAAAAAQLGTLVGPDAYKPFMSPYQQEVIDTTLAEFDRQQAIADTALRDQAIQSWSFWWRKTRRDGCRSCKRCSNE